MEISPDPAEVAEKQVLDLNYVILLYRLLEDPMDKFIVMASLQLGYSQKIVSDMLGVSQPIVSQKLRNARNMLRRNKSKVIF